MGKEDTLKGTRSQERGWVGLIPVLNKVKMLKMEGVRPKTKFCLQGRENAWSDLGECWGPGLPLVEKGVEAGEDEQRQHGTESHEVVELGLKVVGKQVCARAVHLTEAVHSSGVLGITEAGAEILQKEGAP